MNENMKIKYFDEELEVYDERRVVNKNTYSITLNYVPSPTRPLTVENGKTLLTETAGVPSSNQYVLDRENGLLLFNEAMKGKVMVINYSAIGLWCISADKVYTNVDNKGEIIETLEDLMRENREIIESIKTVGDASTVITQLQADIDSVLGLADNIMEGSSVNEELTKTITSSKGANTTLSDTISNADAKINEMNTWVNQHGDIVNLDNRVDTVEIKIPQITEQLDNIEKNSATKIEVDVERNRIDNLVNISSGEVDNVEVSDARIGINGIEYDNLGNAVRLQMNEKIDGDINNVKYYWEQGAYDSSGNKVSYANDTHSRTISFLPSRLQSITNNNDKNIDLLVYDNKETFQEVISIKTGSKQILEDNKLYNIHIAVPFTEITSIINSIIFESKPNKYDKLILEESNKTKKEIGIPIRCEEKSYTNISILPDGSTGTYLGWYTSDFKECKDYKYLICEDVAFFKSVVLNAISFYDSNKNYISGMYYPNIDDDGLNGYASLNATIEIPSNAYYFRDSKYNYNSVESTNSILLCDVKLPITEIDGKIKEIEGKLSSSTDEKINLGDVLCAGDSLTRGDYGSNPPGTINIKDENYPFYLSKFLNITLKANVINGGMCGYTATTYWESKVKTIAFTNVKTIIIMLGTNGYLTDTLETDTNITEEQTYENYANTHTGNYCKIIEYCLEKTSNLAQIFLVTPPKTSQRDVEKMELTVEVIKKIGKKYSLKIIDGYNEFGISPYNFSTMLPIDELHGGKLAYKKMATFIGSNILANLSYEIED